MKSKLLKKNLIIKNFFRILLKPNKDIFNKLIFWFHETLITLVYGFPKPISEFKISTVLCKNLKNWIHKSSSEEYSPDGTIKNIIYNGIRNELIQKKHAKQNDYYIPLNSIPDNLMEELYLEKRNKIKDEVKSPFCIVNSRSWVILPHKKKWGPTAFHRDGFWPGHMKLMIYLTPGNDKYGSFETLDKNYFNKSEGSGVLFLNSDVVHRGIPGTKYNRNSIEITIFRSFINKNHNYKTDYYIRHTNSIIKTYLMNF